MDGTANNIIGMSFGKLTAPFIFKALSKNKLINPPTLYMIKWKYCNPLFCFFLINLVLLKWLLVWKCFWSYLIVFLCDRVIAAPWEAHLMKWHSQRKDEVRLNWPITAWELIYNFRALEMTQSIPEDHSSRRVRQSYHAFLIGQQVKR